MHPFRLSPVHCESIMNRLSRRSVLLATIPASLGYVQALSGMPAAHSQPRGAFVLSGGGKPGHPAIYDTFWRLAGGERAKIVVVPTAHEHMDAADTRPQRIDFISAPWRTRGVASLVVRHTLQAAMANEASFLAPLQVATGVWFGGGDQSRLLQAYRGTRFHAELQQLLLRGGVVGGASAGTAVQSEMAFVSDGQGQLTLEPGLNLLPGTLLDQHFLARNRQARLQAAIQQHPHLLGLGIDEFSALVIEANRWSVVGKSSVTVYESLGKDEPLGSQVLKPD